MGAVTRHSNCGNMYKIIHRQKQVCKQQTASQSAEHSALYLPLGAQGFPLPGVSLGDIRLKQTILSSDYTTRATIQAGGTFTLNLIFLVTVLPNT